MMWQQKKIEFSHPSWLLWFSVSTISLSKWCHIADRMQQKECHLDVHHEWEWCNGQCVLLKWRGKTRGEVLLSFILQKKNKRGGKKWREGQGDDGSHSQKLWTWKAVRWVRSNWNFALVTFAKLRLGFWMLVKENDNGTQELKTTTSQIFCDATVCVCVVFFLPWHKQWTWLWTWIQAEKQMWPLQGIWQALLWGAPSWTAMWQIGKEHKKIQQFSTIQELNQKSRCQVCESCWMLEATVSIRHVTPQEELLAGWQQATVSNRNMTQE